MLSYIDLYTDDAEFNLAAEQYIFDELPRDRSWFMLWQNRKAVIIGKYQNTIAGAAASKEKEEAWDELEKSVITKIADDVIVGIQGRKVDIIVKKNLA